MIIGTDMDHQGAITDAFLAIFERDLGIENLRPQPAAVINPLVWHVANMRPGIRKHAMRGVGGLREGCASDSLAL